jgi:glucose-6-phosphate isomerase
VANNRYDFPISVIYDLQEGSFSPCEKRVERFLSELGPLFHDGDTVGKLMNGGDPLIYEIFYQSYPASKSDWGIGVSRIRPGKIGDEYYMTKGHFHERDDQPEVYFCTKGTGYLLLETVEGDFRAEEFGAGTVTHIPGHWAHRVVNVGDEPMSYIGIYSLSAGHTYARVLKQGFAKIVVERNGQPEIMPNPLRK